MSAVAQLPMNAAGTNSSAGLFDRILRMDRAQSMRLGMGLVLLIVAVFAVFVYGRQQDYRVLFANLGDKDGGAIVAQLSQMNIPYKHADGGGAILVPADKVHDVRLRLASQGLPKGSVAGFELMESSRFGVTQFQERLNFQRGLEGELTRSIQALASVQGARVHLALPSQNGFFREQQKPSASVLLSLNPGRGLDRAQLAGIVHLVASSVPEMSPSAVSVLDDTGKLLSQPTDGSQGGSDGVDAQQLVYVQQLEQQYARRIMEILEPVVGRNNVRAQVSADVDFSQTESTSEQYRPNQTPDAIAIRSQQVSEVSGNTASTSTGVAGAVANQPPAPSAAPINGANPAPTAAGQQGTEQSTSKKDSVTNYEVDKTVRTTRGSNWAIKRLSAAVVVNYQTLEERGKSVTKPLTPQQIEQMTALVRETIGFSQARGDSVNLMNTQFQVEKVDSIDIPFVSQEVVIDLARSLAWPIVGLLFAFLIMVFLIRPAMKNMASVKPLPISRGQVDAIEADEPERPALPPPVKSKEPAEATAEQLRMEDARLLAKENPVAVANILKGWVNGETAA